MLATIMFLGDITRGHGKKYIGISIRQFVFFSIDILFYIVNFWLLMGPETCLRTSYNPIIDTSDVLPVKWGKKDSYLKSRS